MKMMKLLLKYQTDDNQYKDAQSYLPLSFFTANACLLILKLQSLFDCVSERNADFGIITETWIKLGKQLTDVTEELKGAYSLGIISRARAANVNNGRTSGDVALIYRLSRANFKQYDFPNPDATRCWQHLVRLRASNLKFSASHVIPS